MHYVYVLFSKKLKKYYIGETHDIALRLARHNSDYYENKYTKRGQPWELKFELECESKKQAKKIEQHIKKMKSARYIQNFMKYEDLRNKLLLKYKNC